MHEMSLCEAIIETAEKQASIHAYKSVKCIRLEIGKLSCVEPEAMRFAFAAVARNSIADGARLIIDEIAGLGWCSQCEAEVGIKQRYDACPNCGFYPLDIRQGDAMRIRDMEVI